MDRHAKEYYRSTASSQGPHGNFHAVISLNETPQLSWEEILQMAPHFPRGWYELSHLSLTDRIEFTRDFWLSKLSYHPDLQDFLIGFFRQLDEIGIFLTQQTYGAPFKAEMVYSLGGDCGFFQGDAPASDEEIAKLLDLFSSHTLPNDYLVFLRIHNGFHKYLDTGVLNTHQVPTSYKSLQGLLIEHEPLVTSHGASVDPSSLIPFYESFGMPCYQCFWAEWYPQDAMGNIYYSGITRTISDNTADDAWAENLAFPTFTDWLMFYLERIDA